MEKIKAFVSIFILSLALTSCKDKQRVEKIIIQKELFKDSIIYKFPEKTTLYINEIMEKKELAFGYIQENSSEDSYLFKFPYTKEYLIDSKTKQILERTNLFLKITDKFIPLIRESDLLFTDLPNDSILHANDFNYFIITVNGKGKLIDGFDY